MKKIIIKIVNFVFYRLYAKKKYYSFFYFLYLQGLKGLDHGYKYIYPEDSGEYSVLHKIAKFYNSHNLQPIFFDVGANHGYYAKEVIQIFNKNIVLHCFEPSTFAYKKLQENVVLNEYGCSLHNFALSSDIDNLSLYYDKLGSGMASLEKTSYAPPFGIASELEEVVETNTIDAFCDKYTIPKIHVLKMDVEGHELAVLNGSHCMLSKGLIDFIQFEFGRINIDAGVSLKRFYELLSDNYKIYRIISDGLVPHFTYNYEYEIYLGTNFLAVRNEIHEDFNTIND